MTVCYGSGEGRSTRYYLGSSPLSNNKHRPRRTSHLFPCNTCDTERPQLVVRSRSNKDPIHPRSRNCRTGCASSTPDSATTVPRIRDVDRSRKARTVEITCIDSIVPRDNRAMRICTAVPAYRSSYRRRRRRRTRDNGTIRHTHRRRPRRFHYDTDDDTPR